MAYPVYKYEYNNKEYTTESNFNIIGKCEIGDVKILKINPDNSGKLWSDSDNGKNLIFMIIGFIFLAVSIYLLYDGINVVF